MASCRTCRTTITPETASRDDARCCPDCGDLTYAVRPDAARPDQWFRVDVDVEGQPLTNNYVTVGPCSGCGRSDLRIERMSRYEWEGVCRGQWRDGTRDEGCGAVHPIRQRPRRETIPRLPLRTS